LFAKGRSISHAFIMAKASDNEPLGRALDTVGEAVNGHPIILWRWAAVNRRERSGEEENQKFAKVIHMPLMQALSSEARRTSSRIDDSK
jgi:hypothetical protein